MAKKASAKKSASKKKRTAAQKRATQKMIAANKKKAASKKKSSARKKRTTRATPRRRPTTRLRGSGGARRTNPTRSKRYVIALFWPESEGHVYQYVYGYNSGENAWALTTNKTDAIRGTMGAMKMTAQNVREYTPKGVSVYVMET